MAEPRPDGRSPNLGLKFSTFEDQNFNWFKLDETIAGAFTPGNIIQLPQAIPPTNLPPTISDDDDQEPIGPKTLTGTSQDILRLTMAQTEGGPVFLVGVLNLQLTNTTASTATFLIDITYDRPDVTLSSFTWHVAGTLLANAQQPMAVPLAWVFVRADATPASSTDIYVRMLQSQGVGVVTIAVQARGYGKVVELGKGGM